MVRNRVSRSLVGGEGNAFHFFFGMVDNEDEKDLYHKINTLKLEIYKWAELEKRQISIVKTTVHTV